MDGFNSFNASYQLRTCVNYWNRCFSLALSGRVFVFSLLLTLPWAVTVWGADASFNPAFLQEQISTHPTNGLLRFIGTRPGNAVLLNKPPKGDAPEDYGLAFAREYGAAFGIKDVSEQLRLRKSTYLEGRGDSIRYQQIYRGLPVFAGELVVNLDNGKALRSMNAEIAPALSLPVIPALSSNDARGIALAAIAKWYDMDQSELQASEPALTVYDASLLKPSVLEPSLVWSLEVSPFELAPINELILVDAQTGTINLHFNQVHQARNRMTHNAGATQDMPGVLVCSEGDGFPACAGGDVDVIDAHTFAGNAYDFYANVHDRDGIDNRGSAITSTVHWYHYAVCPNAFWSGSQMVYCTNMASADDVVAHELTHGVTANESNLLYYYESGAINESFSDLWGEFIDLTNGLGNDSPSVRWLMGEDLIALGGALRDMQFPESFGDPDRMTSENYITSSIDQGGVHTNSGVNNKAVYLMTDGDYFNGVNVSGIGITKTAKIYYEAQTNILTSAADYSDLHLALYQACLNLVGTSGITMGDCQQVRNATNAVEMNMDPGGNPDFSPEAAICPPGIEQGTILFSDGLEFGTDNWSTSSDPWFLFSNYANSGSNSLGTPNTAAACDARAWNTIPVTITNDTYLHFNHAFGFETYNESNYDGGIIEYSTDGSTWQDLASLFDAGQGYGGTIYTGFGNPLAGHSAFVGESHGYVSSRYNLGALAGQNFQVRFRLASDSSVGGPLGWLVDDVMIYRCGSEAEVVQGCSGVNVLLQNREFTSDTTCQASSSLNANTAVVVKAGAAVMFQSAVTTLGPGFSVELGGVLTIEGSL